MGTSLFALRANPSLIWYCNEPPFSQKPIRTQVPFKQALEFLKVPNISLAPGLVMATSQRLTIGTSESICVFSDLRTRPPTHSSWNLISQAKGALLKSLSATSMFGRDDGSLPEISAEHIFFVEASPKKGLL